MVIETQLSNGQAIASPASLPLTERFAARATAIGAQVHRVTSLDEIAVLVSELAAEGRVVVAPALAGRQEALVTRLVAQGYALGTVAPNDPGGSFEGVTVGISEALLGLVETGSIVVADALPDRLVRMLSPKHVAVLNATAVVPGLDEAGEYLRVALLRGEGGYVSFITGPSRTADIEMSLTIGAHGPKELHIVLLASE